MNALSKLITRVTKRQFAMATTVEQVSNILDRTITFANSEMITETQIEEIAATIPIVEPVTDVESEPEIEESIENEGA